MDKRRIIDYFTKGPFSLTLEDEPRPEKSGTNVQDIIFNDPVSLYEISFRNNYTAYFTILYKKYVSEREPRNRDTQPFHVLIKNRTIMENPHYETKSQDLVVLHSDKNVDAWTNIISLRFILRQPSPVWRKFGIEDLAFYRQVPTEPKQTFVPRMFADTSPDLPSATQASAKDALLSVMLRDAISEYKTTRKDSTKETPAISSTNSSVELAISLHVMKNIVEVMKTVHTERATVGRFEVDGSYDIDHLDAK